MESAADAELVGLAMLFCISTTQLAYCNDQLEDGPVGMWTNHLAFFKKDYHPDIIDRAFSIMEAEDQFEGRDISIQSSTLRPEDADSLSS